MKVVRKKSPARPDAGRIRAQAVAVAGSASFPELAALLIARRFRQQGRGPDARRVLLRYLDRHPETPAIAAGLAASA